MTIATLIHLQTFLHVAMLLFAAIVVLLGVIRLLQRNKKRPTKRANITFGVTTGLTLLIALGVICSHVFLDVAMKHGLYDNATTLSEAFQGIRLSPAEDVLPSDLDDTLVVYYRFGCDECEALHDTIQEHIDAFERETGTRIYWVSTRSEQGKYLRTECPVANLTVPSFLYIRTHNAFGESQFYIENLYFRDPDGTHFFPDAWDKIIDIRDQYTDGVKFQN